MASLVTPEELASRLQSDLDTSTAVVALWSSGLVRAYCGWSISQETVTDALYDGSGTRSIWLPTLLLTVVTSVAEDAVPLVFDVDYTWTALGRLIHTYRWGTEARSVKVTYTHGWAVVPEAVKAVVIAAAARAYSNPEGMRSQTVGSVSWTSAGSGAEVGGMGSLTDAEKAALSPFRIPVLA